MSSKNEVASSLERELSVMNRLEQPVWVFDIDNKRVLWGNASALAIWSADGLEELRGRDMGRDMSTTVADRLNQYQFDFERDQNCTFNEVWTLYPKGVPATIDVTYSGIRLSDGRMAMFCEGSEVGNISAEALRSAEALLHTSVMITLFGACGESLYRNPAARSNVANSSSTLEEHFPPQTVHLLQNASTDEIKTVANVKTKTGTCWHDITARRCLDAVSGETAWLISEVDVSRLKATEERAQFLAEHDTLTKLPNRNYVSFGFQSRIDQMLANGECGSLVFLDLDRFKDINDSLGHAAGDKLLVEVSNRLQSIVGETGQVARLGGDEFLLLLGCVDKSSVLQVAARILSEIPKPFNLGGREIAVTPSLGISLFPENGRTIDDLMRHADLAMYHAKDTGRNDFAFFSQDLSDAVESRINLEAEIQQALEDEQFVAYFQPRMDTQNQKVVGAEALVRWMHPEKGMISPATFIPACEDSGVIGKVGKIVLAQAVRAQQLWAQQGHHLRVSVNLSPLQFGEDSLVEDLLEIVRANHGSPEWIELEITESVLLGNDEATIDKLHKLVESGFRIAIDDFGTGYSNLAYLHRYPIRCLKIDRSFIQIIKTSQPIVELIVQMAKLFELDVVAEGVETEEQLSVLNKLGCFECQGFLFEKAVAYEEFCLYLADTNQIAA